MEEGWEGRGGRRAHTLGSLPVAGVYGRLCLPMHCRLSTLATAQGVRVIRLRTAVEVRQKGWVAERYLTGDR